ncbi:unnamed protein product [Penicillium manginii]
MLHAAPTSAIHTEHPKPVQPPAPKMAPRLLNKLDTIHHIEDAHVLHLSRQVEVFMQLLPRDNISLHSVAAGGVVYLTKAHLGSQINCTLGLALHTTADLTPSILLCPYADQSALQALAMRSYVLDGFLNIYARSLHDIQVEVDPYMSFSEDLTFGPEMIVSRGAANEENGSTFIDASVAGFKDDGRSVEVLESLAESAVLRRDTILYFGKIDGRIAGCGAMALMETQYGKIAHLYIDSTTPDFRGRGVQRALIRARLNDAKSLGYDFSTIHCLPSIGTGRNAEKEGFGLAFTKPIMTKKLD